MHASMVRSGGGGGGEGLGLGQARGVWGAARPGGGGGMTRGGLEAGGGQAMKQTETLAALTSARLLARLSPVWPPMVGRMASGRSCGRQDRKRGGRGSRAGQCAGKQSVRAQVGQNPKPQTVGQNPKPQTFGQNPKPQTVGQNPKPQTVGQNPKPQTVGQNPKPQTVGQNPKPQTVGAR